MKIVYKPRGTCSQQIEVEVEDGIIKDVQFFGGCPGNLLAISKLVKDKKVDDMIELLEGIKCGHKKTSCADQFAQALKQAKS